MRDDPLTYGEDRPVEARVLVDAVARGWVVEQLGEEAVVERRADGSVEVALAVVNRAAFRSWVLDLLDHAEVIGPEELRADIVAWLGAIVDAAPWPAPLVGPRLRRVLALVPYVLAHPGVPITELAERFEVSQAELEHDLELLPLCGLPPYTADRLMDVWMVDGTVEIRLAEYFERPLRLTPAEGLALLAAGRALLSVPGSDPGGPLATALDKLDVALDAGGRLAVHVGGSDHLEELQVAASDVGTGRDRLLLVLADEMTTRDVDPWRVFRVRRLVPRGLVPPGERRAVVPCRSRTRGPPGRRALRRVRAVGRRVGGASGGRRRARVPARSPTISGSHSGWRRRPTGWWRATARSRRAGGRRLVAVVLAVSERRGWNASSSRSGRTSPWKGRPRLPGWRPTPPRASCAATMTRPRARPVSGDEAR